MSSRGKPRRTRGRNNGTEAKEQAGSLEGARIMRAQTGKSWSLQDKQQLPVETTGEGKREKWENPRSYPPGSCQVLLLGDPHQKPVARERLESTICTGQLSGMPNPMGEGRVWLRAMRPTTNPPPFPTSLMDEEQTFLPLGCRAHFLRCVSRESKD